MSFIDERSIKNHQSTIGQNTINNCISLETLRFRKSFKKFHHPHSYTIPQFQSIRRTITLIQTKEEAGK